MQERAALYALMAELLTYPAPGTELPAGGGGGPAADALRLFADELRPLTHGEREELYTRTFDINPVSSLEVGWHLYGEQYERGAFLVKMRDLLRKHGVAESAELPDHLTHVLRLLAAMPDGEAREFARTFVVPAVKKMLEGFKDASNPFERILAALRQTLEEDVCLTRAETSHV
jgi:nitrate reductase delta subunit